MLHGGVAGRVRLPASEAAINAGGRMITDKIHGPEVAAAAALSLPELHSLRLARPS